MNEHDEKIIGEEVTEQKEEPTSESSGETLPETNTEQKIEPVTEPEPTAEVSAPPAPVADVKEYWSFSEQVKADKAAQKKKGRRGALAYAIIMTCLFVVCFALLAVLLIISKGAFRISALVPYLLTLLFAIILNKNPLKIISSINPILSIVKT